MICEYSQAQLGGLQTIVARHNHAQAETCSGLFVCCHGFGASGTDLVGLAEEMNRLDERLRDVVFLFPAAPMVLDPTMDARAWWEIDVERIQQLMMTGEVREMRNSKPDRLDVCRQMIQQLIEQARSQFGVEMDRVIVGGFSQGAMLTTDVMLHSQPPVAGLICWSGTLINEQEWRQAASSQSKIPVLQSHGQADPILPFVGSQYLREMLTENGFEVEFVEFPGPHTIPTEAIHAATRLVARILG